MTYYTSVVAIASPPMAEPLVKSTAKKFSRKELLWHGMNANFKLPNLNMERTNITYCELEYPFQYQRC